jgi:hypothetical protein
MQQPPISEGEEQWLVAFLQRSGHHYCERGNMYSGLLGVSHSFLQMGGRFLALKKFFNKNKIHTVRLMQQIFYLHSYVSADIPPFFPPSMSATK